MKARWHPLLAIAGALALATLGTPMVFAQPGGGEESAVTLSLAVWDQPGRQAEQAALDLVALAPDLSGGIITVAEPNWGMSDAADLVQSGQVDLAILATREWSPFGVKSLDALEAPFLITENALAQAVATSTVADAAMAGLTDLGVTGLVMWPEDLRHLFAFEPFGRAFTTSEDFAGSTILAIAGRPGRELITNLGGLLYEEIETDTQTGDRVLDSLSGVLDGMVTGLWGAGLATDQIDGALVAGDVVLYPKFQVLAANTETLAQLTDTQRAALDDIVVEVHRRALNRHFSEAELAAGICERGGTVVEAGHAAIAELRAAARPLTEAMASDLVMGDVMTRIRALADQTPHGDGAGTCAPISRAATESATLEPSVSEEELAGFTGSELLPDGIYRAQLVAAELEAAGADRNYAAVNDGMWTLAIEGDGWEAMHDRNSEECSGTQEIVDGNIRLKTVVSRGCGMDYDVRWSLDGEGLSLRLANLEWSHTPAEFASERTTINRVWTRIDGAPAPATPSATPIAALPPDGVYRAAMTREDLLEAGAKPEDAAGLQGVVTWVIVDGRFTQEWDSGVAVPSNCHGTYEMHDGLVVFDWAEADYCWGSVEMRVTPSDDGLDIEYVGCGGGIPSECNPPTDRALFTRTWTRIGDVKAEDLKAEP